MHNIYKAFRTFFTPLFLHLFCYCFLGAFLLQIRCIELETLFARSSKTIKILKHLIISVFTNKNNEYYLLLLRFVCANTRLIFVN